MHRLFTLVYISKQKLELVAGKKNNCYKQFFPLK